MRSLNTYSKWYGGRIRLLKEQDFSLKCPDKGIPALANSDQIIVPVLGLTLLDTLTNFSGPLSSTSATFSSIITNE